jgi:hypothetical protein
MWLVATAMGPYISFLLFSTTFRFHLYEPLESVDQKNQFVIAHDAPWPKTEGSKSYRRSVLIGAHTVAGIS